MPLSALIDMEIQLQGVAISEGIAIGTLYGLEELEKKNIPSFAISKREVDHEVQRYRKAISSSREDLFRMQNSLAQEGSVEAVSIVDAHIQMLSDPFLTTEIEEKIRGSRFNTETVFQSTMSEYEEQFTKVDDAFFHQRLTDVKDLSSRILGHLSPKAARNFVDLPDDAILIARELALSDTADAPKEKVRAFLSLLGSGTSHAALIAKSKGIPYVSTINISLLTAHLNKEVDGVDINPMRLITGSRVIVDGTSGLVIFCPTDTTLAKYEKAKKEYEQREFVISSSASFKSETKDGHKVKVLANIENMDSLPLLDQYKADGVGLFRSEYLFFDRVIRDFSEESQYQVYRKLFRAVPRGPIYFRVFDIGSDKQVFSEGDEEANPALGCRSIRFLLRHRDIFRVQLRAILRASTGSDLYLLLPLISDVGELREVKRFIRLIRDDLLATGYRVKGGLKVGSMIEVPSAVMMCDFIADESDFISIGTNDLIQYTLAVDRLNPAIADIYQPSHPSIIRMLQMVVKSGQENASPVSLCGEMASNPLFTSLLLGLGITQLSCSPRYIPLIKRTVCGTNMESAKKLAHKALQLGTSQEVHQLLTEYYCEHHKGS